MFARCIRCWCAAIVLLVMQPMAFAACSRPISVPVAASGRLVVVDAHANTVSGAYPRLLRKSAASMGCEFIFSVVPRARLDRMYETGDADLLLPASEIKSRSAFGEFVGVVNSRPAIIQRKPGLAINKLSELVAHPELRVDVVRAFDWGPDYRRAVQAMSDQGRLDLAQDPDSIVQKMALNRTDATVMTAHIFFGTLLELGLADTLGKQLRYSIANDVPTSAAGVYLANSLNPSDKAQLRAMIQAWVSSGDLWAALQEAIPAEGLIGMNPIQIPADARPALK